MGVPPRIPRFPEGGEDQGGFINSDFCELTTSLTSSQQEYEDDYGVTVYNLAECELPVGLDFEGDSTGYFAIMDVGEPVTITAKQSLFTSTFTTYLIRVESNYPTLSHKFCTVRRRYTEFCWLREELVKNHRNRQVPQLPPKKLLSFMSFNASFIQQRLRGLAHFLQSVLENPTFLRDPALLFFLHSDLSVPEMLELNKKSSQGIPIDCAINPSIEITCSAGTEDNSLLRSEEGDEDEKIDLNVATTSKLSSSPSEDSDLGRLAHGVAKAKPIPVPFVPRQLNLRKKNNKMDDDDDDSDDRLSTSSSEADSGHFEASSSASTSPVGPTSKMSQHHRDLISHHRRGDRLDIITSGNYTQVPSLFQVNEFLLHNPMSYYIMQ